MLRDQPASAAKSPEAATTSFQAVLDQHLQAIQDRNLRALAETLSKDELVLITSDGRLINRTEEFLNMHREWFESPTWSLTAQRVCAHESPELAVAVLKLNYRDRPPEGPAVNEQSYLTLVFARRNGRWQMIHDQNTPCRSNRKK